MSRKAKLIERLLLEPRDFTWEEAANLLGHFGFEELKTGKTGGSRRKFHDPATDRLILLHKPHPGSIMKSGAVAYLLGTLKDYGYINEGNHGQG